MARNVVSSRRFATVASALVCTAGLGLALAVVPAMSMADDATQGGTDQASSASADGAQSQGDAEYSPAVQALFDADADKFEGTATNDNTFASGTKFADVQPEPAQSAANDG